jgi:hypothetical protein
MACDMADRSFRSPSLAFERRPRELDGRFQIVALLVREL